MIDFYLIVLNSIYFIPGGGDMSLIISGYWDYPVTESNMNVQFLLAKFSITIVGVLKYSSTKKIIKFGSFF